MTAQVMLLGMDYVLLWFFVLGIGLLVAGAGVVVGLLASRSRVARFLGLTGIGIGILSLLLFWVLTDDEPADWPYLTLGSPVLVGAIAILLSFRPRLRKERLFRRVTATLLTILGATAAFLLAFACYLDGRDKRRYGPAFDAERMKRSIPILGPDAFTMSDWGLGWHHGESERLWSKTVEVEHGHIMLEYDTYDSGMTYNDEAGHPQWIGMHIYYSYEDERAGRDPWRAVYCSEQGQQELSVEDAEELLRSWGIERLNYDPP